MNPIKAFGLSAATFALFAVSTLNVIPAAQATSVSNSDTASQTIRDATYPQQVCYYIRIRC
jgi:hypothetical protein